MCWCSAEITEIKKFYNCLGTDIERAKALRDKMQDNVAMASDRLRVLSKNLLSYLATVRVCCLSELLSKE